MKGPYDGQKITYVFGCEPGRSSSSSFKVEATSLAKAIRAFRVGTLFPHQFSTGRIAHPDHIQYRENGWEDQSVFLASTPDGYVRVHALVNRPNHGRELVEVARIPPESEDVAADFGPAMLTAEAHLQLAAESMGLPSEGTTALAKAGTSTGLRSASRYDLEAQSLALSKRMAELAQMKRDMETQICAMREELNRRIEQIWMIELFLGSKEEVRLLRSGQPAPVEERITVRQSVLCMDEEIAVHNWLNNPDTIGEFGYDNLEDFDNWLVADPAHLNAIFPHQKGIVGLKVRRKHKPRGEAEGYFGVAGAFKAMAEETLDAMTYLLVRNGENLYRLWVDVQLFPLLFAAEKDFVPRIDEYTGKPHPFDERRMEAKMKTYFAGLLVVQGLIERSDLFQPLPAPNISVFQPRDQEYFNLLRDGEDHLMLVDGTNPLAHLTWKTYEQWLHKQFAVGTRVQWLGRVAWGDHERRNPLKDRTGIGSIGDWPERNEVYTIIAAEPYSMVRGPWVFLYLPSDEVYEPDPDWMGYGRGVPRTRRVRFAAYESEILPVDFIAWRVLEYLLRDRNSRPDYGDFFQPAFHWWKKKRDESERERPFVDLVLAQAGVSQTDEGERSRCERLVRWWKMKTQEHRTLSTDEAKALRMVLQAFKRGDDHENDPEQLLFRRVGSKPVNPA